MLRRIGIPLIALIAILFFVPVPPVNAAVHFGVGIGVGVPAYPDYPYFGYPYGYAAPYPYYGYGYAGPAYPYAYGYVGPGYYYRGGHLWYRGGAVHGRAVARGGARASHNSGRR